jgi:mannose-6-phosphate isomerase-like protein (cupin superfamily)
MDTYDLNGGLNERPWGGWRVLASDFDFTVKLLVIDPGHMLSLQSHEQRDETWQVIVGEVIAYCEGTERVIMDSISTLLSAGHTYHVPRNVTHRLINPTARQAVVLETINGRYDEEDITRYHDTYGRE